MFGCGRVAHCFWNYDIVVINIYISASGGSSWGWQRRLSKVVECHRGARRCTLTRTRVKLSLSRRKRLSEVAHSDVYWLTIASPPFTNKCNDQSWSRRTGRSVSPARLFPSNDHQSHKIYNGEQRLLHPHNIVNPAAILEFLRWNLLAMYYACRTKYFKLLSFFFNSRLISDQLLTRLLVTP